MASTSSSSTDAKGKGKAFEGTLQKPLLPSASSSSSSMVYDVFLNHRGSDVKQGLAKDIYHALTGMGLRVFLDKEELEYGASVPLEIENAMRSASLCIAIFSPKYAESSWCLDELFFMVKNQTKIIPVFYNVQPSDLRWVAEGKGVYVSAFSQHEEKGRYTKHKLEEWKTALSTVSFFYGHELENKEDEDRLLKSIVNSVCKDTQILQNLQLEVAQHPVGLDEILEDFENSAFKSSDREEHVNIVGIVGMGGSGKTTLAKELYNRECSSIAKHSFVFDVRDAAAKNTLHSLQQNLLEDLLSDRFDLRITNITKGKEILRTRLRSLQVLIVLDDVDHVDQIDALLPEKSIFAVGSLIIVTTRELNVLQSSNICCIYKMKALKASRAKQLFCWHAFMQSTPLQEFEDLVEEVINACQGLPLSLKVLGGQLYKKPQDYWVSQLNKISRILPHDILKRLKISFDALDSEEKEMFLDTSCFFLGEAVSLAIEVWNGSGWSGLHGWETLLSKCLVELDEKNRISMHDHLRDMGKQIAIEGPSYRLFPSSNLDIRRKEIIPIRGIMEASADHSKSVWDTVEPSSDYRPFLKEYIKLKPSDCGVQLLVATNNKFSKKYARLSKELRWLRLFKFQHSCLPSWLSLENLRVLELYNSPNLEELWQDNMQQPPLQLRELIIHLGRENRSFQRFPRSIGRLGHLKKLSFIGNGYHQNMPRGFCNLISRSIGRLGRLPHVKRLSCNGGTYLQNLPRGFCNLQSLEHLELQHLVGLSSLPSRFGDLTNLRHLNLAGCHQLKMLPDSFKQLKHLQYVNLEGCSNLTFTEHNADILENITKLEYLSFRRCMGLQVLPHHITKQAFLRELHLEGTSFSELPSSIDQLERLEALTIGSQKLESLPESLGNLSCLTRLKIHDCEMLESLPDSLGNLSSLTYLMIKSCKKVRSLPESLGRLARLDFIYISSTGMESLPKAFRHLISLQTLYIYSSPIRGLFFEFEESSSLPRLKSVHLHSTNMSTISIPEEFCPSLESLDVSENHFLEEIRTLPRTVKTIHLDSCERLKDIAGISTLRNLERLTISRCPKLAELPSFAELASMKAIEIRECQISGKMEGLEKLTSLETLDVHTEWEVPGITSLEHARGLKRLRLSAENIGAVEGCIKTLEKWPGEVGICARALGGVEPLVNSLASSNNMRWGMGGLGSLVKTFTDSQSNDGDEDGCTLKYRKTYWALESSWRWRNRWRLRVPKSCLSDEATIMCFVINCRSPDYITDWIYYGDYLKLSEGKWVWIGAFSRHRLERSLIVKHGLDIHLRKENRVEMGFIATGEERAVKDVFYQVLDVLKM